jgi:hypothetical protein
MRRRDPADFIPRPNKDVDYPYFGARMPPELPRSRTQRPALPFRAPKRLHAADAPLTWGGEPWPERRPARFDARVGDVLAGNLELRATCRCGHSAIVEPEELRRRFEPTDKVGRVTFYCRQCCHRGSLEISNDLAV